MSTGSRQIEIFRLINIDLATLGSSSLRSSPPY
uniref:Uncharacterized protein n=1 Tax=Myoviridae sp. ctZgq1 TaxID=2826666 RepID=A0A8S5LXS4_9CAUD|nr:MAG TPA: hypothetical protein [Myoviridae sp. ctZgq1]